ncbi:DUF5406 family protein [Enterococcus thailandicus]|uniref:DUF5406 family protein n=1 Tax=Enterococcus thailandicus TaxID=417368 RepID=UPI0034DDA79E
MKNYDPNTRWGTHIIKVCFQQWDYKGFVKFKRGGNCKGIDVLYLDADDLYDQTFIENPISFGTTDKNDEWFKMTLKNAKNDALLIEEEWKSLGELVVGVEIVDFIEEKNPDLLEAE